MERITYKELAERVGNLVLCNNMGSRYGLTMECETYDKFYDEETEEYGEIMQWYIISSHGAEYLKDMTDEIVFYDNELDVYVWGVTHWGTSWDYVDTTIKTYNEVVG